MIGADSGCGDRSEGWSLGAGWGVEGNHQSNSDGDGDGVPGKRSGRRFVVVVMGDTGDGDGDGVPGKKRGKRLVLDIVGDDGV